LGFSTKRVMRLSASVSIRPKARAGSRGTGVVAIVTSAPVF
jgi:hypothetical protein